MFPSHDRRGPFTERFVGGTQSRHIAPLKTSDRAEQYTLSIASGTGSITRLTTENIPKGHYLRNSGAKSPLNISNIKTSTDVSASSGVRIVGNYFKNYEVVQSSNRAATNMDLAYNTDNYNYQTPSAFITTPARRTLGLTGSADYPAPPDRDWETTS